MMAKRKKKLGRGFEDLYAQNESDLPFLDVYGKAAEEHGEGLPDSAAAAAPAELLAALERHLRAAGCEYASSESSLSIADKLVVEVDGSNLLIKIEAGAIPLPMVPSDLMAPGFSSGELSADRSRAELHVSAPSSALRRLLDRLIEHWSLQQVD